MSLKFREKRTTENISTSGKQNYDRDNSSFAQKYLLKQSSYRDSKRKIDYCDHLSHRQPISQTKKYYQDSVMKASPYDRSGPYYGNQYAYEDSPSRSNLKSSKFVQRDSESPISPQYPETSLYHKSLSNYSATEGFKKSEGNWMLESIIQSGNTKLGNWIGGRIDRMGELMGNKIDKMGDRLGNKIEKMGESVGNKIDKMGDRLDDRIESGIKNLEETLTRLLTGSNHNNNNIKSRYQLNDI